MRKTLFRLAILAYAGFSLLVSIGGLLLFVFLAFHLFQRNDWLILALVASIVVGGAALFATNAYRIARYWWKLGHHTNFEPDPNVVGFPSVLIILFISLVFVAVIFAVPFLLYFFIDWIGGREAADTIGLPIGVIWGFLTLYTLARAQEHVYRNGD